jgi:hypothetical protein
MADFLGRLAERALGVATVAQPAIAPRFAMGPRLAGESSVIAEAAAVPTQRGPSPDPPRAAPSPVAEGRRVEIDNQERRARMDDRPLAPLPVYAELEPAVRIDDPARPAPKIATRGETPEPRVPETELQLQPGIAPPAARPELRVEASAAETEPPLAAIEPKARRDPDTTGPEPAKHAEAEPVLPHPTMPPVPWRDGQTASNGRQGSRVEELETPAPTVRVSIGRIEVRAVFPEQPQRERAPLPRSPALSLSEYLKQRDGGMR